MLALVTDPLLVGETLREKMVVEGSSEDALFQAWIHSLLHTMRQQHLLIRRTLVLNVTPQSIQADVCGELFDPHRHTHETGVGPTTFIAAVLDRSNGVYEAVLDVRTP